MKIHYLQADCGAGKTYSTLSHIADNPGRYVFAVNKIDLIGERIREFNEFAGSENYQIAQIHSQCPNPLQISVGGRIETFNNKARGQDAVLLFVTHEGLQVADWTDYDGWELIIDEIPAVWGYIEKNFTQTASFVRQYFDANPYGRIQDYLRLTLNAHGRETRNDWSGDAIVEVLRSTFDACQRRSVVLINADNWLKMATKKFKVFTLFEPDHLTVFKSVTILGNRFTDSLLHRCWSKIGVEFVPVADAVLRQPATPVSERLEVIYFSNRQAAFNYFRNEADPLRMVQDWCRKALGNQDVYYTVNSAFLGSFTFPGQERISVLAHGHNKLKDKTVGIFMAAMKGKPHEYAMIRDVFGVSKDEFDLAREYEAVYQFVMRSNLRVYDSDKKVYMYVFSKDQAEFLHKITGAPIAKQDVGLNDNINKGGRPKGSSKRAA